VWSDESSSTRQRNLSKADAERLEEMQKYCEEREGCRRKTFYDKFQGHTDGDGSRPLFKPCRKDCDNCQETFLNMSRRTYTEPLEDELGAPGPYGGAAPANAARRLQMLRPRLISHAH
jgi:superfamily II DNA helicase RecQ